MQNKNLTSEPEATESRFNTEAERPSKEESSKEANLVSERSILSFAIRRIPAGKSKLGDTS